ncbi:ABC transporter ATP-binding protein [Deltaproteobacteria bacterium TL4]
MKVLLQVRDLVTAFDTEEGSVCAVDGVSFEVEQGQILGIVGESGCGKSVTALSITQLLPKPSGRIVSGEVLFRGQDLLKLPAQQMHSIRGNHISMIFQEPLTALNPVHRIGKQVAETLFLHNPGMKKGPVYEASLDILRKVGIPDPEKRIKDYPHQLSGGMRQRVMIAMALVCKPDLLIADEPTTALDVTIQAQILDLMKTLQAELQMAIIFITHDLGVIAEMCDEVVVMYAGQVVEKASVEDIFHEPKHPYTLGLLSSIPRLDTPSKSRLQTIEGMVPDLHSLPAGCRFQNRCSYRTDLCHTQRPQLEVVQDKHEVSCHHWKYRSSPS